ncbi:imidazole glycerol phosphate synthase subunit HisH [Agrococcus casei]|uniref:Imidazole glycerol phosphate synthase subunit HisH n=1 Tax=Agrococcus casei LMG 22410 TaxID=1255656 RepID=A0A1R4GJ03_9MICO|nr:imidazole glycerol phosphate synthase subunit HisH [Agrococcus casei]SJM68158.1 Imidazole glycerol phosphate synthase amidotransferase subunit [Agrococcus casei LMG 22410]
MPTVALLDYGSGNVHSAKKALEAAGAQVDLTRDRNAVMSADGLVVPGVGSIAACMEGLREVNAGELIGRRLAGGRPVLGICVGMQVLFDEGREGGETTEALGEWPGVVDRLDAQVLPHMGWNTVEVPEGSRLFEGIESERFYFVHSYAAKEWLIEQHPRIRTTALTWATHGERFLAAVENGPLTATQFHPEKSGEAGVRLLANWLATLS